MPRKKKPVRIKYTIYKNGDLYVRYPVTSVKNPTWRKVEIEANETTEEAVRRTIGDVVANRAKTLQESAIPQNAGKFFDYWLSLQKGTVSERTYQARETAVRLYLKPALGELALTDVHPSHFSAIYNSMVVRSLGVLSIRRVHLVAGMIFNLAVDLDLLRKNPRRTVKVPKLTRLPKTKTMSGSQAKAFLGECRTAKHGIIFEFALETGARPQEYLALRWSDLDFTTRRASITRALVYDKKGGGWFFKDTKTGSSRRTIPLSVPLAAKLKAHRAAQQEHLKDLEEKIRARSKPSAEYRNISRRKVLDTHRELDLVFSSARGTPLKDVNLGKRYFKPLVEKLKFDADLSLYCLRHTMATLLLQARESPKIVSERLGHASVGITLDTYSHVLPNMQQTATDTLSKILYNDENDSDE